MASSGAARSGDGAWRSVACWPRATGQASRLAGRDTRRVEADSRRPDAGDAALTGRRVRSTPPGRPRRGRRRRTAGRRSACHRLDEATTYHSACVRGGLTARSTFTTPASATRVPTSACPPTIAELGCLVGAVAPTCPPAPDGSDSRAAPLAGAATSAARRGAVVPAGRRRRPIGFLADCRCRPALPLVPWCTRRRRHRRLLAPPSCRRGPTAVALAATGDRPAGAWPSTWPTVCRRASARSADRHAGRRWRCWSPAALGVAGAATSPHRRSPRVARARRSTAGSSPAVAELGASRCGRVTPALAHVAAFGDRRPPRHDGLLPACVRTAGWVARCGSTTSAPPRGATEDGRAALEPRARLPDGAARRRASTARRPDRAGARRPPVAAPARDAWPVACRGSPATGAVGSSPTCRPAAPPHAVVYDVGTARAARPLLSPVAPRRPRASTPPGSLEPLEEPLGWQPARARSPLTAGRARASSVEIAAADASCDRLLAGGDPRHHRRGAPRRPSRSGAGLAGVAQLLEVGPAAAGLGDPLLGELARPGSRRGSCVISAFVASVMMRGPRVTSPYSAVSEIE